MNRLTLFSIHICLLFVLNAYSNLALSATKHTTLIIKQFKITGHNPLGDIAYDALTPFLGIQNITSLSAATKALEAKIKAAGYGFHRVNLPPQILSSGIVELEVIRFTIGNIDVKNSAYFSEQNILRSLPALRINQTPNTTDISRAIKFANNHPSKNIAIEFKKGSGKNEVDSIIHSLETDPQQIYIALENNGARETESLRSTLAYQHSNVFNRDHDLTLLYTTAPKNTTSTNQIALRYQIPLYSLQAQLSFLIAKSESNTGTLTDDTLVTGRGNLWVIEYAQQLDSKDSFEHKITYSLSKKIFDNEIFNINQFVLSAPFQVGYNFTYAQKSRSIKGGVNIFYNTQLGKYNDKTSYYQARSAAHPAWNSVRYNLSFDYTFSNEWRFYSELSGQVSAFLLIPGEQFGLGGMRTLRGIEENSINGDSGARYRLEVWTPAQFFDLKFSAFYDAAKLVKNPSSSTSNDGYQLKLSSAGIGAYWAWKNHFSFDVEAAQIISGGGTDATINQTGDNKLHFKMTYKF